MTEYLIRFFDALGKLSGRREGDVSDAIAYDDGALWVLISMGDVRARVAVTDFDPDPAEAARLAVDRWKLMSEEERNRSLEEVR